MIIFDIETTGLHRRNNQICQLAYVKLDKQYNIEYAKNFYFEVSRMEPGAECTHGLSIEKLKELSDRKTFKDHADEIYRDFTDCEMLIAHNVGFDYGFLTMELSLAGYDTEPIRKIEDFCTMHEYTDVARVCWHDYYNSYKYPKLNELAEFLDLDEEDIENTTRTIFDIDNEEVDFHDARLDVIVTMEAYKLYGKFSKIREYKDMLINIKRAESYLDDLKKRVGVDRFESSYDVKVDDIDYIEKVFESFSAGDRLRVTEDVAEAISYLTKVSNAEKDERKRVAKRKEDELIALIEERVAENPAVIKAVWSRHENWGVVRESLMFGYQLAEDGYEEFNVWLIKLDSTRYLLNRSCRMDTFSVVEVNSGQDENVVNYHGKFEFEILIESPCPEFKCVDNIDLSNCSEFLIIDNSTNETLSSTSYFVSDKDDIPF